MEQDERSKKALEKVKKCLAFGGRNSVSVAVASWRLIRSRC